MAPLVSIIIPTYNRSTLLSRAINSVLEQTHRNIEVIVIDDGSTDDTQQVLENLTDIRISSYVTRNQGASAARNYGLQRSKGDYITFLDSDDEYYPEKIERQLEVFRTSKVPNLGVVSCGRHDIRDGRRYFSWIPKYRGNVLKKLLSKKRIGSGTPFLMIKREVLERGVMFDPSMPAAQDFDFLVQICQHFNFDFAPYHLVKVYHHQGDRVYNSDRALKATALHYQKYYDLIRGDRHILEAFVLRYADMFFMYGDRTRAREVMHNELVQWSIRRLLWHTYFLLFESPKSKGSLAILKTLRLLS